VAEAIRFYMDQHYPAPISQGLRRHGINVLTTQEAGNCGLSDPDQLAFATAEGRVLVTFDPDFLALHRAGVAHGGREERAPSRQDTKVAKKQGIWGMV
jgi:hypothetical protein